MKRIHQFLCVVGLSIVATTFNPQASAQCGPVVKHLSHPVLGTLSTGRFQLAAAALTGQEEEDERGEFGLEPIVGLWKTDFEDPADGYSDKGYAVWHSDHTEFMNSTRPPSVGAICQGVWEKIGHSTYKLNHFALGYMDGVHLTSLYRFKEIVTVDRSGRSFSGTFSIEAVDPITHGSQGTYKGTLTAEKVGIHTTVDSQKF